ncbi:hypothetical protein GIB67_040675, partial [Kingdonia uniflora]
LTLRSIPLPHIIFLYSFRFFEVGGYKLEIADCRSFSGVMVVPLLTWSEFEGLFYIVVFGFRSLLQGFEFKGLNIRESENKMVCMIKIQFMNLGDSKFL